VCANPQQIVDVSIAKKHSGGVMVRFMVFNTTFNNILVISWR
jgi:hydroxymethylglutaryl-CoA reductase